MTIFLKTLTVKGILLCLMVMTMIFTINASVQQKAVEQNLKQIMIEESVTSKSQIVSTENEKHMCDGTNGVCGPPPGWN